MDVSVGALTRSSIPNPHKIVMHHRTLEQDMQYLTIILNTAVCRGLVANLQEILIQRAEILKERAKVPAGALEWDF